MARTTHRAKYILVEPDVVLKNAAIHVSHSGRIGGIEVGRNPSFMRTPQILDWGSAIIIPGLVNAHTHLELTSLRGQLSRFSSFTDWIWQLVTRRRTWTAEDYQASIDEGIRLSLASGTTLIGDIRSSATDWYIDSSSSPRQVVFAEVLEQAPDRAGEVLKKLKMRLKHSQLDPLVKYGISPHAPYTVSPVLYRRAAELARFQRRILATHVAETRAEVQFLQTGFGEFWEFLSTIGRLPADWSPPGQTPIRYLDELGVLGGNCLLIHCNYLDRESMIRISKTRSSVVYCPRSHAFFGHDRHPIRQMLDLEVNVALGTDSLASNTSLSMIDEMRFLYQKRKDITAKEILKAATLNGAAALNYQGKLGCLRQGYWADMTILQIPPNLSTRRLTNQILEGAGECIATIVQGRIVWQKENFHK